MDDLLQTIADQKGYPTEMVERSAAARAKADGVSTEDVLRSWAGVAAAPTAAAPAAAAPEASAAPAAASAGTAPAPAADDGPKVEVLTPDAAEPSPESDAATPADDVDFPEDEELVLVGGFPRWLAVALLVFPAMALLYVMVLPSSPQCGSSGALAIDPETGAAENCDGSEYGADGNDVFAIGESLYAAQCASCHGAGGGGGTGPAFTNGAVLATFSSCTDHIEWVAIGSNGWPESTYGDQATPVLGSGAAMPGFEASLTAEQLSAVSLYERVAFGGEDRAAAEASCLPADGDLAATGE